MPPLVDPRLYVAGRSYEEGPRAAVRDPWSGERLADVVQADAARASEAAEAAVAAFEALAAAPTYVRRALCAGIARGIAAEAATLADLIARDAGKPLSLARVEVARAVTTFELGAEESTRIGGEVLRLDVSPASAGYSGQWTRVPAGPVLALAPFNFPLNLVAHKVAPALAAGCSVVVKPPPQAPLAALALGAIARRVAAEVGAPPSSVQVVPCDVEVAEALVRDDRFATLTFTGSTRVGWHLKSIAGRKRVLLELGNNGAVILHGDGAREAAVPRIVSAAFGYAGQVCIKAQRLYVERGVADEVVADLVGRTRALAPASPIADTSIVGPMIDEASARRVEAWVTDAVASGARVVCGGHREGACYDPTVIEVDGDGRGLAVVDEEVFGPVLTVHRYATWDEALRMANATRYGLQAGLFTDSHARIREAFVRLRVGGLVVNDVPTFRVDSMPFGGMRDSGLGREGVRYAIEEMTERKLLVVRDPA